MDSEYRMQAVLKLLHKVYPADKYEASMEALRPPGVVLTWSMNCYSKDPDTKRICEHGVWAMMNRLREKEIHLVEIRYVSSFLSRHLYNN